MDVIRLGEEWFPDILLEGYNSMIWTERFGPPGEFVMTTHRANPMRELIPEGSFISLRDSREVMIVESHNIEADEQTGVKQNVIRGRTLESFPEEQRVFRGVSGKAKKLPYNYTMQDAILLILYNAINLPLGVNDIIYGTDDLLFRGDRLPDVKITDSTTVTGTNKKRFIDKPDYIGPTILKWLEAANLGIRNIRPEILSANIVTFNSSGDKTETPTSNVIGEVMIDIYNGTNRTHAQDIVPKVVFRYSAGHILSPQYLWTNQLRKQLVWGTTVLGVHSYFDDDDYPLDLFPSGFGRRIQFHDTGEDYADLPDGGGWGMGEDYEALYQSMEDEYAKHQDTFFFDGQIGGYTPYKYNSDYYLGDRVTLQAEYGVDETMRVIEYVRTQDETGEHGYPTLARVP